MPYRVYPSVLPISTTPQVKHASEGDVGATVQDAARMAQAGARGAAQAARLIFEKVGTV